MNHPITILVGPEQKQYTVDRDLICTRSPFFAKCLHVNRFRESDDQLVNLPEDDPLAFGRLVQWLYEGKDGLLFSGDGLRGVNRHHHRTLIAQLIDCYALADKYFITAFKNDLMDTIRLVFHRSKCYGSPTLLRKVYARGLQRTPLSGFLVKSIVYCMQHYPHVWTRSLPAAPKGEKEHGRPTKVDLLTDLAEDKEMMQSVMAETWYYLTMPYDDPAVLDGCLFHEHRVGEDCGDG